MNKSKRTAAKKVLEDPTTIRPEIKKIDSEEQISPIQ